MHILPRNDRVIVLLFIVLVYLLIMTSLRSKSENIYYPIPFEPEVREDFPTVDSDTPRIPHIMHYIFISGHDEIEGIPAVFFHNVKLFLFIHSDWTVYFWSDTSARQLISARYPSFLSTWDNYTEVIKKADAFRYFALYEFGGVYSDLDTKFVRSIDRATMKYACIISPEPFEHSTILYQKPFQLNNGIMLCRKNHPFMKQVISSLPESALQDNLLKVAGPMFLTEQFILYNKLEPGDLYRNKTEIDSNSPYFYKGALKEDDFNAVYVPNTQYFMGNIDWSARFDQYCEALRANDLVKRGCTILKEKEMQEDLNEFAFTDHMWTHMYLNDNPADFLPVEFVIPPTNLRKWRPDADQEVLTSVDGQQDQISTE